MIRKPVTVEARQLALCREQGFRSFLARRRLRLVSHIAPAIVAPDEDTAAAAREITGGVGAPVVVAEPDPSLPEPRDLADRRFLARPPEGPRVLLIATAVTGMGGIARYEWFWATAALDLGYRARITALWKWGAQPGGVSLVRRLLFTAKALFSALVRRPDATIVSHVRLSPVAHLIKRLLGIPYAVALHGDDSWRPFAPSVDRALRNADLLIPVSHVTRDIVAAHLGMDKENFYVTGSIVSPALERLAKSMKAGGIKNRDQKNHGRTLLTVARLDANAPYKRHDLVIEAVAELAADFPDLRYEIVGDGEYRPELEQLARRRELEDRVRFVGKITESELAAKYRDAYAFVMPSRFSIDPAAGEGFGLVYLEAGIFGTPSVAARGGGSTETVLDEISGLLADPDSLDSLIDKIRTLLEDRSLRDRLGRLAIERGSEFGYGSFKRRCGAVLGYLIDGIDPRSVEPEYSRSSISHATS